MSTAMNSNTPCESEPIVFISSILPIGNGNGKTGATNYEEDNREKSTHSIVLTRSAVLIGGAYCFTFGAICGFFVTAILVGRRNCRSNLCVCHAVGSYRRLLPHSALHIATRLPRLGAP